MAIAPPAESPDTVTELGSILYRPEKCEDIKEFRKKISPNLRSCCEVTKPHSTRHIKNNEGEKCFPIFDSLIEYSSA